MTASNDVIFKHEVESHGEADEAEHAEPEADRRLARPELGARP